MVEIWKRMSKGGGAAKEMRRKEEDERMRGKAKKNIYIRFYATRPIF